MPRSFPFALGRIVHQMARLSPPRHRELVGGMVAELHAIADPAEQTRFALGAIAAITRLALSECGRFAIHLPGRIARMMALADRTNHGDPPMSPLTTRQLLRRHAVPFAVSFASLSLFLVGNQAMRLVPQLNARGASTGTIVEVLLLAVPFIAALTIPMAVFLAVSWVFMRLGADGVLARAQGTRHGVRRLVAPVMAAATVIAALAFVSNTQVVPRTNARFAAVLAGAPVEPRDRTMTLGELRDATQRALTATAPDGTARAAVYEVEIQKKFALAAASVFLAVAAAALAIRFPHGGRTLTLGASVVVFIGYYVSLVAGESLADRQVISPFVAMWMANAFLLAVVLLLAWRPGRPGAARGEQTLAIGG